MNAVLAFAVSYVMVFFIVLIFAGVLLGSLAAGLDLCQVLHRWKTARHQRSTEAAVAQRATALLRHPSSSDMPEAL